MTISGVVGIMEQMIDLHHALLELSERKKSVLIRNDVDQLTQITARETKLIKQLSELEQQRISAVNDFFAAKGIRTPVHVTVSGLVRFVIKAEEKEKLTEVRDRLMSVIRKLKEANDLNRQLIQQSLEYIEYSVDIIAGAPEQEAVYHNPKQQNYGAQRTTFFDTKA